MFAECVPRARHWLENFVYVTSLSLCVPARHITLGPQWGNGGSKLAFLLS